MKTSPVTAKELRDMLPDSLSETLSPRIVADLETTLTYLEMAEESCRLGLRDFALREIAAAKRNVSEALGTKRRRRPRGENGAAEQRREGLP